MHLGEALGRALNAPVLSPKAKRPKSLIYGVDETAPLPILALNGAQHVGLIAINLVYPLLILRSVGAPVHVMADLLSLCMLVLAAGTMLQAARIGPVGSGYMCPATFSATYLAPALLAARAGGLPLVAGMTMFAGVLETLLAPLLNRLRSIFPPEVSGLVILMIGISVGLSGLRLVFAAGTTLPSAAEWWAGGLTLGAMTALSVWGKGVARMLCALLGLLIGYLAAAMLDVLDPQLMHAAAQAPWIGLPSASHVSWSFDPSLVLAFAIAAVAAAMKAGGTITVCQRVNDANWVRPDMRAIMQGVLADGLSTIIAGLAGTFGTNTSTPAAGLASATGVASRRVAYMAAALFFLLSFFPRLSAMLAIMPRAVIVPALLFSVTFICINGLQVISSRLFDARRTMVVGFGLIAGLAVEVLPSIPALAPTSFRPVIGSSVVFATVIALALNLLFRFGVRKTAAITIAPAELAPDTIEDFLERQGGVWGARPDVIKRAIFGVAQLIDALNDGAWEGGPLTIEASFDEFNLDIRVVYQGRPIPFPAARPSQDEILADGGVELLAGYIVRQNADRVTSSAKGDRAMIAFKFDH